jgi:hypothetical protein
VEHRAHHAEAHVLRIGAHHREQLAIVLRLARARDELVVAQQVDEPGHDQRDAPGREQLA